MNTANPAKLLPTIQQSKYIFHFIVLVYNYCGIISIALDFHWVYVFGDMSSNSIACLDHVDQRYGTQHKQDHAKWAALPYTPLNVDFVCRVNIHHDLACDVLVKHLCQIKKITFKAQCFHGHE